MSAPDFFSFNNRDVDGNESEEPESSDSESDSESIPPLISEDFAEEDFAEEDVEDDNAIDDDDDVQESHPAQWKIETVLRTMKTVDIGVAEFLDGVSWSESVSRSNESIKGARAQLFHKDSKLASILQRWAVPPRSHKTHKKRPKGGSEIMNKLRVFPITKQKKNLPTQWELLIRMGTRLIFTCIKRHEAALIAENRSTALLIWLMKPDYSNNLSILPVTVINKSFKQDKDIRHINAVRYRTTLR